MQNYRSEFIRFCLTQGALKFGQFKLKSGRISPYFFNAGALMKSGAGLAMLAKQYAYCIKEQDFDFDIIYGPAYKGIPLAAITATELYQKFQENKGFCHNRKELKSHGEGGQLVGETALQHKKILILDDVITAGTAIKESLQILQQAQAILSAVVLILDRQEKNADNQSTIQSIADQHQVPVCAIINLDDILQFLEQDTELQASMAAVKSYREQYGS